MFHVFKVRTQTPFLPDPYIHFTCILHFIWDPLDCCSQLLAPFTVCLHGYKAAYINQQLEKLHLYIFELYHWRQRDINNYLCLYIWSYEEGITPFVASNRAVTKGNKGESECQSLYWSDGNKPIYKMNYFDENYTICYV